MTVQFIVEYRIQVALMFFARFILKTLRFFVFMLIISRPIRQSNSTKKEYVFPRALNSSNMLVCMIVRDFHIPNAELTYNMFVDNNLTSSNCGKKMIKDRVSLYFFIEIQMPLIR